MSGQYSGAKIKSNIDSTTVRKMPMRNISLAVKLPYE